MTRLPSHGGRRIFRVEYQHPVKGITRDDFDTLDEAVARKKWAKQRWTSLTPIVYEVNGFFDS